jgi:hypothetical protein
MQESFGGAAEAAWSARKIKASDVVEFFIALHRM